MNKPVYLGLSIIQISKTLMYEFWVDYINPIQDGLFRGCSRTGGWGGERAFFTMMKLGTVIPYLKKIQKNV